MICSRLMQLSLPRLCLNKVKQMEEIKIVLASKNKGKIAELRALLSEYLNVPFSVLSLDDIGFDGDIEENGYFCVESIVSESGETVSIPEIVLPGLNSNIFMDNCGMENECVKKKKRIPRKLKKSLKKQKK